MRPALRIRSLYPTDDDAEDAFVACLVDALKLYDIDGLRARVAWRPRANKSVHFLGIIDGGLAAKERPCTQQ